MQFIVKFVRQFEAEIEAESTEAAVALAQGIVKEFPTDTCRVLSIVTEGYVEQPCPACEAGDIQRSEGTHPHGNPSGGGNTPGTPTVKVPMLVDQIAEAA